MSFTVEKAIDFLSTFPNDAIVSSTVSGASGISIELCEVKRKLNGGKGDLGFMADNGTFLDYRITAWDERKG